MKQLLTLIVLVVTSIQVHAASMLPTGVFTGVQADATATVTDVMSFVVPIGLAVTVGFAVLGWTKKGTRKALS